MQNHSGKIEYVYAGFWIRFAAHMIDAVIVAITLGILNAFLGAFMILFKETPLGGEILFNFTLTDIIEYILTAAYFIIMTYFEGGTIGKKILKLKVVSVKEDGKLTLFDVIYRETVGRFLSDIFCGIGYLTVAFTEQKTAIHDMLCGTRVIYPKKMYQVYQEPINVEPVNTEAVNAEVENTEVENTEVDFVPRMVEEPEQEVRCVKTQEEIRAQWDRILNPQKEENIPQDEEQKKEGDS